MDINYDKLRTKLVAAIFIIILGGFFVLGRILPKPEILQSERRVPAKFPPLSANSLISGEFMEKLDYFAADNFPFRDSFRTLSSALVFGVFLQTDKNGLYMDDYGAGEFKPVDQASVEQLSRIIRTVADSLGDVSVYYAYIPDKSIYSDTKLPGFDPVLVSRLLAESPVLESYTFIDLVDVLDADSYYGTDLHWDQSRIRSVPGRLGGVMGFEADLGSYSEEYAGEFHGGYTGQLALPIKADSLYYLSSPSLSAAYLDDRTMEFEPGPVYDIDRITGLDPYDFFLSGVQPLIILENRDSLTDRELYLFRDSFSSALAPLLASAYSKVFLIDLRYIDMRALGGLIEFKPGSDALFLYSTLVLNNADMLLVR